MPSNLPSISPPALAKFAIRPVCSHHWKLCGSEAVRFVSIRGAQNPSASFTWVNGTAVSFRCGGASAAARGVRRQRIVIAITDAGASLMGVLL